MGRNMQLVACTWTPKLFVGLMGEIAWPVIVLVLGWRLRGDIGAALSAFFSRHDVEEVTAGVTGIRTKFVATQQDPTHAETGISSPDLLPKGGDYEAIKAKQGEISTEFSALLYLQITRQTNSLEASDGDKITLLSQELSLYQAATRFEAVRKVLFRSQFDLFSEQLFENKAISNIELNTFFEALPAKFPGAYTEWDSIKYMAFPVTSQLIENDDSGYKLTLFGRSFVAFMRRNPHFIDEMAKI